MSSNEPNAGSLAATRYRVAVLVPCYNEEHAIAKVVADFRASLPDAAIYVYDNNSTDGTVAAARQAGAVVRRETYQGKGHVVRRMFNDVEADVYVLVDGDATYDAPSAPKMIAKLIEDRLDMVVAARVDRLCRPHFRPLVHRYPVRLSRIFPPFRQIVSDSFSPLRNRDRVDRSCPRA